MFTTRPFRDPAAGEAGGGLPLSLEELFNAKTEEEVGAGEPGEGEPGEGENEPGEGAEPGEGEKSKPGEGEEPKEGEEPGEEEGEPGEDDPLAFYTAVDQLTGTPVTVDYGEVDPLSPEGVALRDKAVRQDEVSRFENHLKTNDPRSYAYFLHRSAGGDDESFFAQKTVALPDEATFQNSVEAQTSLYRKALIDRGVDEDIADASVAKAIKDNTLGLKAAQVYKNIRESQARELVEAEEAAARQEAEFVQKCDATINTLNSNIDNGSMKFIVPDAKKVEFKQFVKDSLRHEDGKFYAVSEITGTPQNVLEALYFQYIKGDLKSLIEKRAETKAVQRLKLGVQKASGGLPKGATAAKKASTYVPLGSI